MENRKKRGFTIVELVIVIAVIAILAAVLIPTFSGVIEKANNSADVQLIRQANLILEIEEIDENVPESEAAAKQLLEQNGVVIGTPTNENSQFVYVGAENRMAIWSKTESKITFPEDMTDMPEGWTPEAQTQYVINIWQQKIGKGTEHNDTNYEKTTKTLYGVAGQAITPEAITGFDTPTNTATVDKNGATVADFYYTRKLYELTYNYNVNRKFERGSDNLNQTLETGFKIDWGKDFTIEQKFKVAETTKRYFLIGSHPSAYALSLEINTSHPKAIRVWRNSSEHYNIITQATIADQWVTYKFASNAANNQYTLSTTVGDTTNEPIMQTYPESASVNQKNNKALRIGSADYRGTNSDATFSPIEVSMLKITVKVAYGDTIPLLSDITQTGYTFDGWYNTAGTGGTKYENTATMPDSNVTLYAHWTANN